MYPAPLLSSVQPLAEAYFNYTGNAVIGSGIRYTIDWARKMNPSLLSSATLDVIVPELPNIFGGYPYPEHKGIERGPSALFIGIFGVLALACFYITGRNMKRGHNFFLLFGLGAFCVFKVIGYSCRLAWNGNIININLGICSIVFIQVAQLVLLALNKILAHRIFTWRHPETGAAWWITAFFNFTYLIVLGLIAMAIVGEALPYLYFLGPSSWMICQNVMQAAAVLNVVYACLPFGALFLAYVFKPGQLGPNPLKRRKTPTEDLPPVVQPYWIESASPLYFPAKGSVRKIFKGTRAADAIRIMPSREPPAHGLHENYYKPMNPNSPKILTAILTVLIGSTTLLLNTCFRCASTFQRSQSVMDPNFHYNYWASHPYVMFIFYGATEALVLSMYLWMRIDLRFYIPDMAGKRSSKAQFGGDDSSFDVDEPIMVDEPKDYLEENAHV